MDFRITRLRDCKFVLSRSDMKRSPTVVIFVAVHCQVRLAVNPFEIFRGESASRGNRTKSVAPLGAIRVD